MPFGLCISIYYSNRPMSAGGYAAILEYRLKTLPSGALLNRSVRAAFVDGSRSLTPSYDDLLSSLAHRSGDSGERCLIDAHFTTFTMPHAAGGRCL